MTTEKTYADAADKILDLVDENPTQPFTLERRELASRIARLVEIASDKAADEDDAAYQSGYDEGYYEAKDEVSSDFENEIRELEEQINDLERELESAKDEAASAFAEGYQTAAKDNDAIETIKFD